jgi:uncharacterized membrane protein
MTSLSELQGQSTDDSRLLEDRRGESRRNEWPRDDHTNVGSGERVASVAAGSLAVALGLSRGSLPGLVIAAVGGALVYRGATGQCPMYSALDINTNQPEPNSENAVREELDARGIHVEQSMLINRTPGELYQYWRNFENLPGIMTHLQQVRVIDDKRSHWVAKAPRIAGGSAEWDAEITADEPNARIAWRSLPGSEITCAGEIRFVPGMGDRGTDVHVSMDYVPPAGKLGHWIATMFGESPRRQMHEDIRNFKRLMEVGEIPTIVGQPRGTCTGTGTRESA